MKFARWVFLIAGIYGLLVTVPLYFYEQRIGVEYPPPISHPEYYYGFIGVTLIWQLLFLMIARQPLNYRSLMIFSMLEKASMIPVILILCPQGRFPALWIPGAGIDLAFGLLFLVAYIKTARLVTT